MRRRDAREARAAAAIDEIDGRDIRIGERWLTDFSSPCHLGLDLDEEVIDAIPGYLARWGVQTSWTRPTGLHEQLAAALTRLLGAERLIIAPAIEPLHLAAVPGLAGSGTVFLDDRAGPALVGAVAIARRLGATVRPVRDGDPDRLASLLAGLWRRPGLVCVEGLDPVAGEPAALASIVALAGEHGALTYVDDTTGLGVLGERSPFEPSPYGIRGNGTAAHLGVGHGPVVLAGSLSGMCASPAAFLSCPETVAPVLDGASALGTWPQAVAALATAIEALRVNEERGDRLRSRLHRLTERALAPLRSSGLVEPGRLGLPTLALAPAAAAALCEHGLHAPAQGRSPGPVIHVTAAHTDDQLDGLVRALGELAAGFKLRGIPAE